ncbi:Eisosome component PIL1-domain-containing protein [Hyaloraphidium curvatum]|nr:Eisosome component PIL1-domain-containing protein [Hyaloraphidium curvatum]
MNVFRAVQSAVAHDSLMKNVLTEEKDVVDALHNLAKQRIGASKVLADWGVRDGDDLGVILTHTQTLNDKLSSYIDTYADKYQEYRAHLKTIYAREESMDSNRQKRSALEKKLQQHVKAQKADVAAIQREIQMFDRDLAQLEADHMTYKRNSVAMASTVQWDSLLELAAKMQIIATFGKYLTEQIPLDRIPPGIQRPPFAGGAVTQQIVQDCHEALMAWRPPTFGGETQPAESIPSPTEPEAATPVSPIPAEGAVSSDTLAQVEGVVANAEATAEAGGPATFL